jgi:hypothetical protein
MFGVPIIASILIWGFFKEPENNTLWGKLGLGAFIVFFLTIIFLNDYIKKVLKNFELQDKNALLKNHALTFGLVGIIFAVAYLIAEDALIFCGIGFSAHSMAFFIQILERKYYKLWKG